MSILCGIIAFNIYTKIVSVSGVIKRLRPYDYVHIDRLITVYNSILQSQGVTAVKFGTSSGRDYQFQNRAPRIILVADYRTSSHMVLGLMNWEKLA